MVIICIWMAHALPGKFGKVLWIFSMESLTKNLYALADECKEPMKVGPCRALFPRFYYDVNAGKCTGFGYGGCMGNNNNFATKEECEQRCSS